MEELTKKAPSNSDDDENLKGQATASNKQGEAGSDEEVADSSSNA